MTFLNNYFTANSYIDENIAFLEITIWTFVRYVSL